MMLSRYVSVAELSATRQWVQLLCSSMHFSVIFVISSVAVCAFIFFV